MEEGEVRVGVIGLGHNGRAWCDAYARHPGCRLAAVCDRDPVRLASAAAAYGVPGFEGYDILDQPLDLISIHTPDHLHADPFVRSLQAGMHVVVEKPMANDLGDLARMVEAADMSGKKVLVGQVLRWNPLFRFVKKLVADGVLGEVYYLEGDYNHDLRMQLHMEAWKVTDEKPIVGGGCHPFDLLRWYAGDAVEVFAYSNHAAYPEMHEDTSIVSIFRFASGAMGKVTAMYAPVIGGMSHGYNLAVYGTKGSVVRGELFLEGLDKPMPIPVEYHGHPYDPEVDHVVRCITDDEAPLVDAHEGANSAAGVLCAHEAARSGRPLAIPHF